MDFDRNHIEITPKTCRDYLRNNLRKTIKGQHRKAVVLEFRKWQERKEKNPGEWY
jgi:hypothetical protein